MKNSLQSACSAWSAWSLRGGRSRSLVLTGVGVAVLGVIGGAAPSSARAVLSLAAVGRAGAAASPSVRVVAALPVPVSAGIRSVVLLNGDRAVTRPGPGGQLRTTVLPARGGGGIVFSLRTGRRDLLIPADALPYLGRGLSPSLFDLASLRRAESGERLPVLVSYTGRRPDLPGVTITRSGDRQVTGYLTGSSAPVFYAALGRQFRADRARASYGLDGLFAGGVTIALPGTADARSRVTRPRPDFAMRPVTVIGTNLAGKPDTGDEAFVINAANPDTFSDPIETANVFYHGTAKFSVPAGTYWAIGSFVSVTKHIGKLRLVVLPQFRVAGNHTRIHLAERTASSELGAVTPRPSRLQAWVFGMVRSGLHGSKLGVSAFGFQRSYVWLSPTTRQPSVGSLHTYETQTLSSPAWARGTPYIYNLALAGPAGIIPDQHIMIAQRSLATITERFYQDVKSVGETGPEVNYPALDVSVGVPLRLRLPGLQTEYMTGTIPSVTYEVSYGEFFRSEAGGQGNDFTTVRAGQKLTEIWNQYPLHPQPFVQLLRGRLAGKIPLIPSALRMGDKLSLFTTAFSDNTPGHTGVGFFGPANGPHVKLTGRYAVFQNGVEIAHGNPITGNPFAGLPPVTLSHKRSLIRFVLSGSRQGKLYRLSTGFQTTWTWRSAPHPGAELPPAWLCSLSGRRCKVQPMMTLNYKVHGMSLNGSTAAGRQVIGLTVGHLQLGGHAPITGATVQVSVDGGRTWRQATVKRTGAGQFTASFTAPAGAGVTLRTHATDSAGGSITETIDNAYRTS